MHFTPDLGLMEGVEPETCDVVGRRATKVAAIIQAIAGNDAPMIAPTRSISDGGFAQ